MATRSGTAAAGDGGGSSSTVSAEAVTGWHVLKVEGYSRIKGVGVGKPVNSGAFSVGGHSWCLKFFPDGYDKEGADWICVALRLDRPAVGTHQVRAGFKLSLLDEDGEPVPSYTGTAIVHTFSSSLHNLYDPSDFIKRKELESLYLKDDSFQIRCDVTVISDPHVKTTTAVSRTLPPADLHQHLGNLLGSKVGGDVMFQVGSETFVAHKYVLAARSSVFMAELFGPMKEKVEAPIRIEDMEEGVFKAMLHFIYTDSLPQIDGRDKMVMAQHLLVAADRYNLERLKLICENMLCSYINAITVVSTLVLAEQHCCLGLKDECFKFLRSPGILRQVMATDDFKHLSSSCPSPLRELLMEVAP